MPPRPSTLLAPVLVLLFAGACDGPPAVRPRPTALAGAIPRVAEGPVVAEVNGRPIAVSELTGRAGNPGYGESRSKRLRDLLSVLIDQELLAELAEKKGYGRDPEVQQERREAGVAKLRAEIYSKVEDRPVDEAELRALYDRRFDEFFRPIQISVTQAVFQVEEQALGFVRAVRRRISARRSDYAKVFATLAEARGGQESALGWTTRLDDGGDLPKPHSDAIYLLSHVGAVTMPLMTDGGFVVFQRTGRRDRRLVSFSAARLRLHSLVKQARRKAAMDAFVREAAARMDIQSAPELVDRIVVGVEPTRPAGAH